MVKELKKKRGSRVVGAVMSALLVTSMLPLPAVAAEEALATATAGASGVVAADVGDTAYSVTTAEGLTFKMGLDAETGTAGVITAYSGTSSRVVIPDEIEGLPVCGIAADVFKGKRLTSVTLGSNLTYIGKSAFENNNLTSVYIPDSVTTICEDAFKAAGSQQLWGDAISFTGLKGVTSLASGSFAGMFDAAIEVPALTEVSADAFQPKFDGGYYASPCYVRLLTTNNNAHNLQSVQGVCIVDPLTYTKRAVDIDSGAVLDSSVYYGKNVTTLSSDKELSEFFSAGDVLSGESVTNDIPGYARPKATQDVTIGAQGAVADFGYKPFAIKAPLGVSADQAMISGTTLAGAAVTLSSVTGTSYWNQTTTKLAAATANEQGEFSFDLSLIDGFSLQDFTGFLSLDASIDSADYAGSAYQAQIAVGAAAPAAEGVEAIQLKVKQGESVNLPIKVAVKYADGSTKDDVVVSGWTPRTLSTAKPGVYWARAKATDYTSTTENSYTVLACITVESNEGHEKADMTDLLRALDDARAMLRTAVASADGSDVSPDEMWVTQETYDTLSAAISHAANVATDASATQDAVDQEQATLAAATETFKNARQTGTGGVAAIVGTLELQAWFEQMEGQADPGITLRATDGTTYSPVSCERSTFNEYFIVKFADIPLGDYKIVPREGLVPVTGNYSERSYLSSDVSFTEGYYDVFNYVHYAEGYRVDYVIDSEKGSTDDELVAYYLPGEALSKLPVPYVTTTDEWVFDGYTRDGVNLVEETQVVEAPLTLTALFHHVKEGALNENTYIDDFWQLGDYTYDIDVESDDETRGRWYISGFSPRGKQKLKLNTHIALPSVTYEDRTDGSDDNSVPYVGFSRTPDESGQLSGAFEAMGLTGVEFSEGIVGIYPLAFYENNIKTVEFPEGLEWVGVSSFLRSGLTSVTFNDDIKHIREGAFADNSLSTVEVPDSVTVIEGHTFSGNGMRSVKLPAACVSIGERAFWGNSLTEVQIPLTLKKIADNAFEENGGQVILRTPDGTNPNELTDSPYHKINPGQQKPEVDKSALLASIEAAEKLRAETTASDNGAGVPAGSYWVPTAADRALERALVEANYQYESSAATEQTVDAAKQVLEQAFESYKAQRCLAGEAVEGAKGDVNNNGKVNIVDAQLAYDLATNKLASATLSELLSLWGAGATIDTVRGIADFNGDGTLDAADAFAIQHAAIVGVKGA